MIGLLGVAKLPRLSTDLEGLLVGDALPQHGAGLEGGDRDEGRAEGLAADGPTCTPHTTHHITTQGTSRRAEHSITSCSDSLGCVGVMAWGWLTEELVEQVSAPCAQYALPPWPSLRR